MRAGADRGMDGLGRGEIVGLLGNAAELFAELLRRQRAGEALPNGGRGIVTDQIPAHDPRHSCYPAGWSVGDWRARQESEPAGIDRATRASMRAHVEAMVGVHDAGVPAVYYGNNIR